MILDLVAPPWILAIAAPQAFASSCVIAIMTVGMYTADSGLVSEAYEKYNDVAVDIMNIILHGVPFLTILVLIVRRRRVIAKALPTSELYSLACGVTAYAYAASYFMTFSPVAQYELHGISNTLVRTVVTCMQSVWAVLGCWYLQWSV